MHGGTNCLKNRQFSYMMINQYLSHLNRAGLALTATSASQRVETLADFNGGLSADTTKGRASLAEPATLTGSLLWACRGYIALGYLRRVAQARRFFSSRARAGMTPQAVEAFREDGKRLCSLRNKPLQAIHG